MAEEIDIIRKDVDEFLSKNKEYFDLMKELQRQVVNLTKENFPEAIKLINDHLDVFFKDHGTTYTFIHCFARYSLFNFPRLELVLDICIHFRNEIRTKMSDFEIISILQSYQISINYLFSKQFFPFESIFKKAFYSDEIFINYLPEIEEYDPEYAKIRLHSFYTHNKNSKLTQVYKDVYTDPKKHILNRSLCYHPSPLHKSIRDDDIETFQDLLSKNNYGVNYEIAFSIYERAQTIDSDLSLIQVAATYGAINIFKFLWMQKDINPPKNLLLYAFFGCNSEIIHIVEEKFPDKGAVLQAIYLNRLDFLDYYIENFSDQLEEKNEKVKTILEKYHQLVENENDENDRFYEVLNSEQLYAAIDYFTIPVIQSALQKICYIIRFIELDDELEEELDNKLIVAGLAHIDLFKFLFSQRKEGHSPSEYEVYYTAIKQAVKFHDLESFKFLFGELKDNLSFYSLFSTSVGYSNRLVTNYMLDLQIEELKNDPKNAQIHSNISDSISIDLILAQIFNYDEEIIAKMFKLYDFFRNPDDADLFVKYLMKYASRKMIEDLLTKIFPEVKNATMLMLTEAFKNRDKNIASFIVDNLQSSENK